MATKKPAKKAAKPAARKAPAPARKVAKAKPAAKPVKGKAKPVSKPIKKPAAKKAAAKTVKKPIKSVARKLPAKPVKKADADIVVLGDSSAAGMGTEAAHETVGAIIASGVAALTGRRVRLTNRAVVGAESSDLERQLANSLEDVMSLTREAGFGAAEEQKVECGLASIYSTVSEETASGEDTSAKNLTAAHQSLRFGTQVPVENQDNGRSAVVRITDRGPFVSGRIIDVSQITARELGFAGLAQVCLKILSIPENRPDEQD